MQNDSTNLAQPPLIARPPPVAKPPVLATNPEPKLARPPIIAHPNKQFGSSSKAPHQQNINLFTSCMDLAPSQITSTNKKRFSLTSINAVSINVTQTSTNSTQIDRILETESEQSLSPLDKEMEQLIDNLIEDNICLPLNEVHNVLPRLDNSVLPVTFTLYRSIAYKKFKSMLVNQIQGGA